MSQKQGKGGDTMQNLSDYNCLKKEFFAALPESERAKYGDKASEHNSLVRHEPDGSQIFKFVFTFHVHVLYDNWSHSRNQKDLVSTTLSRLHELIGHGWGQHSNIVFFVIGAYRDENKKVITFKYILHYFFDCLHESYLF